MELQGGTWGLILRNKLITMRATKQWEELTLQSSALFVCEAGKRKQGEPLVVCSGEGVSIVYSVCVCTQFL